MALLTSYTSMRVGLGVVAGLLVGCSFVLDPDELRAELYVADTVDTVELAETDVRDTQVDDLEATDTQVDDTEATDTQVDDTEPADTQVDDTEATDTQVDDTEPADTQVDDTEPADTQVDDTEPADTQVDTGPSDTGPTTQLVVETSGEGNCILDFYVQGLTSCPKTCGWTLVFDARKSTGISSFSWRLSVSNGYLITPSSMTGPVASVVISTPACLFFPASSMRPANVTADVSLDGGPWVRAAVLPFTARQVTTCGASLCAPP